MRILWRFIGTVGYAGYAPLAPGTVGSFVAFIPLLLIPGFRGLVLLAGVVLFFFLGVRAATEVEKAERVHDPPIVVIDEVVGQWTALLFLPMDHRPWIPWGMAFILFRLFDVVKPFPAYRSQRLPAGWGVMADDVVAGIYANLVTRLFLRIL